MSRQEILITRYGEFCDMISCLLIYDGRAKQKRKKRVYTYDEAINLL